MSLLSRFVCLSFLTFSLLIPPLVQAQQQGTTLENPGNGKHYSGIGVISGWQCAEGRLTIRFNDGPLIPLAYGTERPDTRQTCGHTTTGFVSIYNWARLQDGQHTAVLYNNGAEVARSTFTVGTAGTEFVRGVQTSVTVRDFPSAGEQQLFEWNQNTQHMEMVSPNRPYVTGTGSQSPGSTLENPGHALNYSGIGVISGWKCSAVRLTARVNGGNPIPLLYGNERQDTQPVCGHTGTGFIAIQNWGEFGDGQHEIVLYDADVEFARSTFTVGTAGDVFLRGAEALVTVGGIPYAGQTMDFRWVENSQHLEMVGIGRGLPPPTPSFGPATIAAQGYTQNTPITALLLPAATGGTAPLVYSLSPALPAGLSFNQTTRTLSGTPTSTLTATIYTYTVTDANGATASLTFSLTVTASTGGTGPSFGAATIADQSYTKDTAITSLTLPHATGGTAPLTYSLSPALPTGLSFNPGTRVLSGTPTATQTAATYTYTVTDGTGATATLTFSLTVSAAQSPSTFTNSIGMEMVLIPAGTFQMGSPASETGRYSHEGPVHQVTIGQGFYLGKYEVTQAQWRAVMGTNPSHFSNCGDTCPVERVSWNDVQGFIEELNSQEKVTTYRLPTEAEWEYAARAGTTTAYSFGNAVNRLGLYAWYNDNASDKSHPVGGKRPNGFGLYDVHGNVYEWVKDCWNAGYTGAPTDGSAWLTGDCSHRVIRSGSWYDSPRNLRSAERSWDTTDENRTVNQGFRLARSVN